MKEQHKKESPVLSLLGMGGGGTGTALGGLTLPKTYVDDVFGTFLYEGNGTAGHQINNGIDLAGEGGLVWLKRRDDNSNNSLYDSIRGQNPLWSNSTAAQLVTTNGITSFNSNGFTLGSGYADSNHNGGDLCSWTFRKQPGFFDVVTYTGNGTAGRTVAHNLGSVPGMIVVKRVNGTESWFVNHVGITLGVGRLMLDDTAASSSSNATTYWNNTAATSSVFTVGAHQGVNGNGDTYVAYIFANDDARFGTDDDESIIKCGITPTMSAYGNANIELGFEPQFLLVKPVDRSGTWVILDVMRGIRTSINSPPAILNPNSSGSEGTSSDAGAIFSTGFRIKEYSGGSTRYIYMAIRRPNKPPTAATEVFNPILADTPRTAAQRPEKVDMYWFGKTGGWGENIQVADRVRGFQNTNSAGDDSHTSPWLKTAGTGAEAASGGAIAQENRESGPFVVGVSAGSNFINYIFKRAPGFFDIVAYSGNSVAGRAVAHNLGVVPELMLVKRRNQGAGQGWNVYAAPLGNTSFITLNTDQSAFTGQAVWNSTTPTSSVFYLNNDAEVNSSSYTYIAYLFATLPGISKVGSYTGSSGAVNVDCGFTNGARFVMVKKTSGSGDWVVWDTLRGIGSGNDPFLKLNESQAQTTNQDLIAPLSSGFTINNSGVGNVNASGQTYLFLAIA